MRIRTKLALAALSILALPWAGWQFVQRMETLLRQGQEQALLASAEALARGIAVRPGGLPPAGESWHVHRLEFAPRLDGQVDDWRGAADAPLAFGAPRPWLRVVAGRANERLHLWISVDDASAQRGEAHWPGDLEFDRLQLSLLGRAGELELRLANSESGPLKVSGADGLPPPVRIEGHWRERAGGYDVELALPQDFSVRGLGIGVRDLDAGGTRRVAGTLAADGTPRRLPLHGYLGSLEPVLLALAPEGMRVRVADREGWVVARAGALRADPTDEDILPWRRALYRTLLFRDIGAASTEAPEARRLVRAELAQAIAGEPAVAWRRDPGGARLLLSAAVPLEVEGQVRGAVLLERSNSEVLVLTDQALSGLLGVSAVAFLASGGLILLFAGRLGQRIRRLRDAAERALDREGRVTPFPRTDARDEVGDLSRSFARLLDQVAAYTDYLRTLAGKLSHELNTPLAIVRTSLDNLELASLEPEARAYVGRARDGIERMGHLVRTMSEVTRIEHAIEAAEAEDVDLRALLADCAEAYRGLLAPRELHLDLPPGPLRLRAAPELVVQALDKLVDNARGFTPEDGWVRLSARAEAGGVRIALANRGPTLPATMRGKLFDSLVSLREKGQRGEGAAHLGFGLYVVRLVADLHRGRAEAHDLPDGDGVEFTLHLRGMP
ncbi:ATP-binding protein [Arenimonas caeni]|jgi:dedicated sortase system histidine kinase|uniref:ATP-binding protein n=1 Tax=Arenimonas caeni TaxID=2058085 RepID=UPI002A35E010|nr:ATP-binding protein [Arenimonas caeni]MDY0022061.1 histidine kinase dimerization/phospho-acceptor domain-containing protein [Arenimonas caeni]